MTRMSKTELKKAIPKILDEAATEAEHGNWDNTLSIMRRAEGEIVLNTDKQVTVQAGGKVKRTAGISQSMVTGFEILGVFTPKVTLLGISDIADALGISRSTTHRYVTTLVMLGQLTQEPATRKYRRVIA